MRSLEVQQSLRFFPLFWSNIRWFTSKVSKGSSRGLDQRAAEFPLFWLSRFSRKKNCSSWYIPGRKKGTLNLVCLAIFEHNVVFREFLWRIFFSLLDKIWQHWLGTADHDDAFFTLRKFWFQRACSLKTPRAVSWTLLLFSFLNALFRTRTIFLYDKRTLRSSNFSCFFSLQTL